MLHRHVSITGSRIKRVTFYIMTSSYMHLQKGAKGNVHIYMFVILNTYM